MKYWILTTEFPPFYGGGISTYCDQTSKMLISKGINVTVFIPYYDSETTDETFLEGIRIIRFNPSVYPSSRFLGFAANLSNVFSEVILARIATEGAPDVIETQEYLGIGYYLFQKKHLGYAGLQSVKLVLTLHAPTFLYFDYNQVPLYKHPDYWTGEMERFSIRAADICISPSGFLVEAIRSRMDLSGLHVHVLPNPFKADYLDNPVPDYVQNEIIFYGKITPQKGCIELLKYFSQLWEEGWEATLRLVGGGQHLFHPVNMDLSEYLKNKYNKYIERGLLIFDGEIKPSELATRLNKAHVIVVPSIVENLPYAVLETMSMGKVVLASKQGGQREIVSHSHDGFLFDHGETGSFIHTLKEILSLPESEIKEIGQNAKEKIRKNFSPEDLHERKMAIIQTTAVSENNRFFPLIRPEATYNKTFDPSDPILSVIIPFYNMGNFLAEAINSIRKSEYSTLRIIIVNDGSTEEQSLKTLKSFEKDTDITVIHKKNEGLARARNTGAYAAKGDFLAFLDPDDTVEPLYYTRAITLLTQKDNLSFVGCWAQYFGESRNIWPTFNPEPPYVLLHNSLNTSALVYKRSHFLDAGLNDPAMLYGMEDYESMISMIAKGYRGASFPETWWNYRIRKDSMAQAFTTNSKLYLYNLMAEKHAALYRLYGKELFMLLNSNGPSINIDNPTFNRGIYSKFACSKLGQLLIRIIKKNKQLRSVAIRIYKKFVK